MGVSSGDIGYARATDAAHDRPGKLEYLESIRGIAAFIVVIYHFVVVFLPEFQKLDAFDSLSGKILVLGPVNVLSNGAFAVRIFFVLSGFVLSLSFLTRRNISVLASAAVRRYFRLSIPVIMTVLVAYLLLKADAFYNDEVASLTHETWLAKFYNFEPSLVASLKEGLFKAYFTYDWTTTHALVLWTMKYEFLGSLLVFAMLSVTASTRNAWVLYLIVGVVLVRLQVLLYIDFLIGSMLCRLFVQAQGRLTLPPWLGALGILAALALGGLHPEWIGTPLSMVTLPLGATILIAVVAFCPATQRFLETDPFLFLGRISFGLYLGHWLVLMSLTCGLYVWAIEAGLGREGSVLLVAVPYVAISILLGVALYHVADKPAIALGWLIWRVLFKPSPVSERVPGRDEPLEARATAAGGREGRG